jgi:hypothetical protein
LPTRLRWGPGAWKRLVDRISAAVQQRAGFHGNGQLPLRGYDEHRQEIPYVDSLSDDELQVLNRLLPWNAFTVDGHGRRFGNAAWRGKRDQPQEVPDRRVLLLNERFGLADKHVLEVGCFEGVHTVALAGLARRVTAVDGRIENVVKTIVRTALYGQHPTVFRYDVESSWGNQDSLRADILHHVGVLYHLKDPVRHLLEIGQYIGQGVMLDTHYALPEEVQLSYAVNDRAYQYKLFQERGRKDVFSGLHDHSKWLPLELIVELLRKTGFSQVEVAETRRERYGPRVLLFARR